MATPVYERHTLLHLSRAGRDRIAAELAELGHDARAVGEMLLPEAYPNEHGITAPPPGIARREEFAPREGFVPVGFVSWRAAENGRLRTGSFAAPEEIEAVTSPEGAVDKLAAWDAARAERTPALAALGRLRADLEAMPVRLGVWGSAALEIETGLPYTHAWSDLDARLLPEAPLSREALEAILALVTAVEGDFGIRVDAEIRAAGEYGIALKELLGSGVAVLGKRATDAALLSRKDVLAGLAGFPGGADAYMQPITSGTKELSWKSKQECPARWKK